MKVGDTVRMTHFTHHEPLKQIGYKAPTDEVFVFILVGTEPKEPAADELLDPEVALRTLGWEPAKAEAYLAGEGDESESEAGPYCPDCGLHEFNPHADDCPRARDGVTP